MRNQQEKVQVKAGHTKIVIADMTLFLECPITFSYL